MNELNPYAPPESPSAGTVETIPAGEYGGIGRLAFAGYRAAIYFAGFAVTFLALSLLPPRRGTLTDRDEVIVSAFTLCAIAMTLAWLYAASRLGCCLFRS